MKRNPNILIPPPPRVLVMENMPSAELVTGFKVRSSRKLRSSERLDSKHIHTTRVSNGLSITKQMGLGPKIKEMLKSKLSLGQKILRFRGAKKVFKLNFSVNEGEILVKAFRCYLSTTAGPIAGFLFISTNKVAFCSMRSVKLSSLNREPVKILYKVSIPLMHIKKVGEGKDVNNATKKYIEIVTRDDYDFWFMEFRNHQRTFAFLQQAIPQAQ